MRQIEWLVYSLKNREELERKIEESALLCLVPRDYEDLGLNMADIVRYLKQLQSWGEATERLYLEEDDEDPAE